MKEQTAGIKQGKVWGTTNSLFCHNNVECHLIGFEKGGYCSLHYHQKKWNRFIVLDGILEVVIFRNDDDGNEFEDCTYLIEGQMIDVPPGLRHNFKALENGSALEIYWVDLDTDDIIRNGSTGGMKNAD